ncbi:uncharacterized protein BDW43DRAFT_296406 [Aspergillus alliaceus]|uniref:uncharacterized protein n=1 Tax=Petromyces alliaceus TaxID=209559 RepID=UPI0012A5EBFB|nr:uncharacterized protein BDW43DRAFT_296406 [Aspergillus alliaceus]KAB8239014.1 hypothetical protein BDW43DRAFT_296406 [Aspergillus alliaceus]
MKEKRTTAPEFTHLLNLRLCDYKSQELISPKPLYKLCEDQKDTRTNTSLPLSSSQSTIQTTQSIRPFIPHNLWQAAYKQLDKENEVIHLMKEQYKEFQQKANGEFRTSSRKIINAALSFKVMISTVAALDPTQHTASAWAIMSLGLTMTKNYHDLRDALFESLEYLADILAQCAFIEKKYYLAGNSNAKQDLENALIRLYRAILHYTVLVRKAQDASIGRKLLDCVTAITDHRLKSLKHQLKRKGKNLLSFVSLHVTEGASYDSYINQHEDFCLRDTRTDLCRQLLEWAESDGKFIFWLKGIAGTGKSTIARTVAQSFKNQGLLGATFFFKQGEADCSNLVMRHRCVVPSILNTIKNNPDIASKFLSDQFDKLFYQPLIKLYLDQENNIQVILQLLFNRPELLICLGFKQDKNYLDLILHKLPVPLVKIAIPLFIFAATICCFIKDRDWLLEKLTALAQLAGIQKNDIRNQLNRFHSVLNIPDNHNAPVCILHLSFRNFLVNTKGHFHVNKGKTHMKIVSLSHCLPSYRIQRKDIKPQVINQHLTADLQYSCHYWVYYLKQSKGGKRFLHWLGALALIGGKFDAVGTIDMLESSDG